MLEHCDDDVKGLRAIIRRTHSALSEINANTPTVDDLSLSENSDIPKENVPGPLLDACVIIAGTNDLAQPFTAEEVNTESTLTHPLTHSSTHA